MHYLSMDALTDRYLSMDDETSCPNLFRLFLTTTDRLQIPLVFALLKQSLKICVNEMGLGVFFPY